MLFFESSKDLSAWLRAHHKSTRALKIGFRTRPNGHACISIDGATAEMLRFGWRSGRKIPIDTATYAVVFKPYAPGDAWTAADAELAQALLGQDKLTAHGRSLFDARAKPRDKLGQAVKPEADVLSPMMMAELKRHPAAWASFHHMPASHQRKWTAWVMAAKQEETRARRFAKLLLDMNRTR